jgi:CRISPR-associated endonuclease Csy4
MKFYIELTLIDNSELGVYDIWSKLYTQLHLAMVEMQDSNKHVPVGVSFPEYKIVENKDKKFAMLGSKLRLFAKDEAILAQLNLNKWLERLTDYVHIKSMSVVPEKATSHLIVNRYREPRNPEALARRFAKRHSISVEEALNRLKDYKQEFGVLPYIQLKSLTGGENFNLFISQKVVDKEKVGAFSTYGLSSETTVPHW